MAAGWKKSTIHHAACTSSVKYLVAAHRSLNSSLVFLNRVLNPSQHFISSFLSLYRLFFAYSQQFRQHGRKFRIDTVVLVGGTTWSCFSMLVDSRNHFPGPTFQHLPSGLSCKLAPPTRTCSSPLSRELGHDSSSSLLLRRKRSWWWVSNPCRGDGISMGQRQRGLWVWN